MQITEEQKAELTYRGVLILVVVVLLIILVKYMNREGFEERFGYDSEREPQFGMSENEIEQRRWQMMVAAYGGEHHHH